MAQFLEWSDDYETGIGPIDNDHRGLFKAVNDLHDAYAIGDADAHFADLFDLLSDYVDAHFAREEEAMRRVSYPDLESHLVSHHELTATVHEYAKLNPTNPCGISRKEVLKFFGNWLFGHILGSDMAYVPYISRGKR